MALGTLWTVIQQASGALALTSRGGTAISEPWLTGDASPGFLRYKGICSTPPYELACARLYMVA